MWAVPEGEHGRSPGTATPLPGPPAGRLVNPHDIARHTDTGVECACGWTGPKDRHEGHRGIETARAALATKGRPDLKAVK